MRSLPGCETRNAPRAARGRRQTSPRQQASFRPRLEALEDRCLLSGYQQTNLVGYQPGMAHFTDPNLNGWGMTSMPDGSFVVANTFTTGLATFYDRSGHVLPRTITVPVAAAESAVLGLGRPPHRRRLQPDEGLRDLGKRQVRPGPPDLRFDRRHHQRLEPRRRSNPCDRHTGRLRRRHTAVYTGLDIAQNSQGQNVLYATDFINNRVDMIDGNFTTIHPFTDPTVTSFATQALAPGRCKP